ncbi:MAG TPA: hypothetical protein VGB77_22330 [Abditibacteriaceae bacterium]
MLKTKRGKQHDLPFRVDAISAAILRMVLLQNDGALERWQIYQFGLNDGELEAAIAAEFGTYQEVSHIEPYCAQRVYQFMGKDWSPLVALHAANQRLILFGRPLLKTVRQLMAVPDTIPASVCVVDEATEFSADDVTQFKLVIENRGRLI